MFVSLNENCWTLLIFLLQQHENIDMGSVTKLRLSCYLVLLSIDSKTRQQDSHSFVIWPISVHSVTEGVHLVEILPLGRQWNSYFDSQNCACWYDGLSSTEFLEVPGNHTPKEIFDSNSNFHWSSYAYIFCFICFIKQFVPPTKTTVLFMHV